MSPANLFPRKLFNRIKERLITSDKVIILYGPRQVGKTTLAKKILEDYPGNCLHLNADLNSNMEVLSSRNLDRLQSVVSGYDLLFIDEAQRIPDIGINLKILHDQLPDLKILVTGSSSLDLANRMKEPLTGRTWTFTLYPISVSEWMAKFDQPVLFPAQKVEELLIYGSYPEQLNMENKADKRDYLHEISSSYLYKDILSLANIRYPEKLGQLLKLLSFQIGNLISIQELASSLQLNREAVLHYLDLLEKAFVIFRLSGFSRNLRKEIVKMDKIYFYDLGIRNTVIENFNPISFRTDVGALWENFLLIERKKLMEYDRIHANQYFWRTHTGAELDYVEERGGQLHGYEFKWRKRNRKAPSSWLETYANSSFQLVHQENFMKFLS